MLDDMLLKWKMIVAICYKSQWAELVIQEEKMYPPYFIVPEWENQIYTAPADTLVETWPTYGLGMILKEFIE